MGRVSAGEAVNKSGARARGISVARREQQVMGELQAPRSSPRTAPHVRVGRIEERLALVCAQRAVEGEFVPLPKLAGHIREPDVAQVPFRRPEAAADVVGETEA